GYAIAREMAIEGATIVICARTKETLKKARDTLATETGAKVYAIPADLSRYEDVKRVTETSIAKLGRIDVLVNNNGGPPAERVESLAAATAKRDNVDAASVLSRFEKDVPMKRLGEPEEFAALAAFLASERASYITAQSIAVDGGWIRGLM